MERVADYIVRRLNEEGVKHIFFIPGSGCMYLTDALARNKDVSAISMHHEQAAAMAALSYAKYNEKLGSCFVTTGCGGTNTITGVLHAWQDSVPCVFVSGQAEKCHTIRNSGLPLRQFGRQETDIVKIVESITKYSVMVNDPKDIVYQMDKAIYLAQNGRKGPVWIDVPLDVQNALIDSSSLEHYTNNSTLIPLDRLEVEYVYEQLSLAKRPILLIGNGIRLSKAIDELNEFVYKYKIPVTYSRLGADLIDGDSNYSIGMVGALGSSRVGSFAISNSDLILSIGCRLSINTTGYEYDKFARNAKLIVVDIDSIEHSKNTVKIDKFIHSDAKEFLSAINKKTPILPNEEWLDKCLHWKDVFPKSSDDINSNLINMNYFIKCLSDVLPELAIVISDAGDAFYATSSVISMKKGQRNITSGGEAEMGYALPGAIGISYATDNTIIVINGDGSIMMNLQELQTVAFNKIPLKICVMNNDGYSCIRTMQNNAFRGRVIGVDDKSGIGFPNFNKIADAFGIKYIKIEGSENLSEKIKQMINFDGPILCEVMCIPNQDFVYVAQTMNSKKRFVTRPLEDMAPFIERDKFLSEMIINPIDQ